MNSSGHIIMCFKDDLTYKQYGSALMLATPHTWCGIIIHSLFHLFAIFLSRLLDQWRFSLSSQSSFNLLTPPINFSYKRLLPKSHGVLGYNHRLSAVFKRIDPNLCTASKDFKHRLVIYRNCLDFWPIKLPKSWVIICKNALQGDVLTIKHKLKMFCAFGHRILEIWIRIVQGSWQQLQISGPVEWNELFF